ncbi:HET domain containing protein [Hyaloscypha variabilis]
MPEKPTPTSGINHRKRKRDDVTSANTLDALPKSQKKVVVAERETTQSQIRNVQGTGNVGDMFDGVEPASNMKVPTPNKQDIGQRQLVPRTLHETDKFYPTILPSFKPSKVAQTNPKISAPANLCRRCREIDLDTLLSRPHKTHVGQAAKKLSPASTWKISSCVLCSLFQSTFDYKFWRTQVGRKVPLRTYSSNKMEDKVWSSITTNLMKIGDSERYLVSQPEGTKGPVQIIRSEIDSFECVKDWISLCSRNHKMCNLETRTPVPGQKLIDCETRAIIPREGQPYVALSYVWGRPSDTSENLSSEDPSKLPANLPHTIWDAMTVTKRLGYQYLWVDRYCINQRNKQEQADQVGKMDLIYQNAELTIIAAIGEDPNYGLPGVGYRKRKLQKLTTCAKVGEHFLISIQASPKTAIDEFKWGTRAWTYQEGLLSRRRLVFLKEQMVFECYGMYCYESLHLPLETMHRKDMHGFKSVFCSEKRVGMFPKGVGTTVIDIVRRIEEYSERTLTHPSDILKGMLGIFHAFETSRLRLYHYGGIPLLPAKLGRSADNTERWTRTMGFLKGLFWESEISSDRRHGFPSWSWTGWHGPVKWKDGIWPSVAVDPNIQVKVELADGHFANLENFDTWNIRSGISNIIHITAWTIDIKILRHRRRHKRNPITLRRDQDEYDARLELEDGGHLEWYFESNSKAKVQCGEICKGIILGFDADPLGMLGKYPETAVLVFGKVGDTMERIGLGWIGYLTNRYDKNGVHESNQKELTRDALIEALLKGTRLSTGNPNLERPPKLVKTWEEIQLG